MRKVLLFILLALLGLNASAQDSVLGIDFGSSYSTVKSALETRYGLLSVHEDKGTLSVYGINIGDYNFNLGTFDFQYSGTDSYFYYAEFQKNFGINESSLAKNYRESLRRTLSSKYRGGTEWLNDQGYKCYSFATPARDPADNPVCMIITQKAKSKGGKSYIYVILAYGPYHFIDEASDF